MPERNLRGRSSNGASAHGLNKRKIGNADYLASDPSKESILDEDIKTESKLSSTSMPINLPIDITKPTSNIIDSNLPNTSSNLAPSIVVSTTNKLIKPLFRTSADLNLNETHIKSKQIPSSTASSKEKINVKKSSKRDEIKLDCKNDNKELT